MTTVSHRAPKDKPHYTYVLKYPEDYPELDKAGTVFYVGKGLDNRIDDHEREARKNARSYKCSVIRKIWRYGCQVKKNILAYFGSHEEAFMYEIALIFFMDRLTNLTAGGEGIVGLVRTKEHQRKIGEARRGQRFTPEQRQRLSEAHKNSERTATLLRRVNANKKGKPAWNKGKPMSEEHRRKNGDARRGIPRGPHSEETKRKISNSNRGKKRSEATRRRIGESQRGIPRGPFSENHKQKLREARKRQVIPPRTPEALCKFSETMKGHPVSPETRRKIGEANKGHRHTPEARQRMSETRKGRVQSEATRQKRSESMKRTLARKQAKNQTLTPRAYIQGRLFP